MARGVIPSAQPEGLALWLLQGQEFGDRGGRLRQMVLLGEMFIRRLVNTVGVLTDR